MLTASTTRVCAWMPTALSCSESLKSYSAFEDLSGCGACRGQNLRWELALVHKHLQQGSGLMCLYSPFLVMMSVSEVPLAGQRG